MGLSRQRKARGSIRRFNGIYCFIRGIKMKRNVLFFVLVTGLTFSVFGQSHSDFQYTENNGKITITGYTGSEKDIIIPALINNLPVTVIGERALFNKQLTSAHNACHLLFFYCFVI
jgi:hypothetical protein